MIWGVWLTRVNCFLKYFSGSPVNTLKRRLLGHSKTIFWIYSLPCFLGLFPWKKCISIFWKEKSLLLTDFFLLWISRCCFHGVAKKYEKAVPNRGLNWDSFFSLGPSGLWNKISQRPGLDIHSPRPYFFGVEPEGGWARPSVARTVSLVYYPLSLTKNFGNWICEFGTTEKFRKLVKPGGHYGYWWSLSTSLAEDLWGGGPNTSNFWKILDVWSLFEMTFDLTLSTKYRYLSNYSFKVDFSLDPWLQHYHGWWGQHLLLVTETDWLHNFLTEQFPPL